MAADQNTVLSQTVQHWLQSVEQLYQWYEKLASVIDTCQSTGHPLPYLLAESTQYSVTKLMQLREEVYQFMVNLEKRPLDKQSQTMSALVRMLEIDTQCINHQVSLIQNALDTYSTGMA